MGTEATVPCLPSGRTESSLPGQPCLATGQLLALPRWSSAGLVGPAPHHRPPWPLGLSPLSKQDVASPGPAASAHLAQPRPARGISPPAPQPLPGDQPPPLSPPRASECFPRSLPGRASQPPPPASPPGPGNLPLPRPYVLTPVPRTPGVLGRGREVGEAWVSSRCRGIKDKASGPGVCPWTAGAG